jgi:AcrR family transcriptional regulator
MIRTKEAESPVRVQTSGRGTKETAILDAAESVFGARGFQKTTMNDIAVEAHVSRPLIYRYFRGTAHTVRLVLLASLEFARNREVLRGLLGRDSRQALADYSDVIDRGSDMLRGLMREILGAGVRRGDVRADLDLDDLAHVVSEVFLAYADHIVRGECGLGERRIEAILETLLHGFIAKPPLTASAS